MNAAQQGRSRRYRAHIGPHTQGSKFGAGSYQGIGVVGIGAKELPMPCGDDLRLG